jgi:hypothetical protein
MSGSQEEGRRKKEEGRNYRSQVKPGNAFHCCCASSFLRGGRASRNSFLGSAKERDNESRNERFLRCRQSKSEIHSLAKPRNERNRKITNCQFSLA